MKSYPSIPRVGDAPSELLESGHLWVLEKVDGAHLRFQLQQSGLIRFGDRECVYNTADAVPEEYDHAVEHIRDKLDRDTLRDAVDQVETVVFFGESTHRQTIEYEWERLPSFLGFEIWDGNAERFLTPDRVEQIFERLGLHPVNTLQRELPARDFDPDGYELPQSAWYDGPPEGVVLRDKTGNRAKIRHPQFEASEKPELLEISGAELAAEYATDRRFQTVASTIEALDSPLTFEALYERVEADIRREAHHELEHADAISEFHNELASLTSQFLENYEPPE